MSDMFQLVIEIRNVAHRASNFDDKLKHVGHSAIFQEGIAMRLISLVRIIIVCAALFLSFSLVSSPAINRTGAVEHVNSAATVKYVIDAPRSKFMARAFSGGLLWFKGHDHHLAAGEFSGEVEITPDSITPASLHLVVKAASLVETGVAFTEPQKQIINKELREIVLHPDKYPDITFRSTSVTAKPAKEGGHEVEIDGDLTLHGVTRRIDIPARVTLQGDDLRAVGEFSIDRGDFKVKATSAFHGLVRVRDRVKFTFDIVARRR